ncbi:MAG TPA: hypothetical protein VEC99_01090, partial [Clostridia bacterium]|nr:hypothetical protein [Clostridia bacterium]
MLRCLLAQAGELAGLFILIAGCAHWTQASEPDSRAVVFPQATNLTQLLDQADALQDTLLPVHLEGVACWIDPTRTLVAFQDNSRLAFLEMDLSKESVNAGDSLVIEGDCLVKSSKFNLRRPPVLDNDGVHGLREKAGTVFLRAGKHPLKVLWFDNGGKCELEVSYEGPNLPRKTIPGAALFRAVPDRIRGTTNWVQGLEYRAYEGTWENLPDFEQLTPVQQGAVAGFDLNVRTRTNNVGLVFTGFLEIPCDGRYTFYTRSDDGSRLSLQERPTRIEVRARQAFPEPRKVIPGQRFSPEECQWSQVEGKATFIYERPYGFVAELRSAQGRMIAVLPDMSRLSRLLLTDARLRLRGVGQGLYATDNQPPVAGRLLVPSLDMIEVLSVPPLRWTAYPISPIHGKTAAPPDERSETIVHLRGKIRSITTGRDFTLEDATGFVSVETLQPLTASAGTAVEVLGRWRQTGTNTAVVSALWRETADRGGPGASELPGLTTIEQIHTLKREEAERRYPVHIRGVVTYVRLGTADGVLQDSTRGVYVQNLAPPGYIPLDVGDYLEVEGETRPGDFAPILNARKVTLLG